MLDDRDYMKTGKAPFRSRPPVRHSGISAVKTIILANIACFIVQLASPEFTNNFALVGTKVVSGEVWRLVTSLFLHDNRSILSFHLLFNMWGVYLFGSILEEKIGRSRFYWLYFISGIGGGLLWTLFNQNNIPCIGASGALFGVIVATTMFFPNVELILFFPPIPMKLKTFSIVFILLELFFVTGGTDNGGILGNIAHLGHLGGALAGYIFTKIFYSGVIVWDFLPKSKNRSSYKAPPSGWGFTGGGKGEDGGGASGDAPISQKELDRLLDKISMGGINNLSEDELERLRKAREQMRGKS
ncbi:MAG: rhomboid family intramembrane serine protease [Victivallales bacterium]|nr:rhomboid family intramembrane serine protease [Victivallales bacterium]